MLRSFFAKEDGQGLVGGLGDFRHRGTVGGRIHLTDYRTLLSVIRTI